MLLSRGGPHRRFHALDCTRPDLQFPSLQDLVGFLGELNSVGCDLYLDKQAVDTTTPAGRALFHMLGVFAEFERAIISGTNTRRAFQGAREGHPTAKKQASMPFRSTSTATATLTSSSNRWSASCRMSHQ
jgi:hypothetical protein